jgi:hypothetical protein
LALKRLTAEFGMGSGLIASPKATRPAKNSYRAYPGSDEFSVDTNIDEETLAAPAEAAE